MMKKTLIALAAIAATSAFAQSQVRLSGVLDAGVYSLSKADGNKDTQAMIDSSLQSSRWQLDGSEDLGGGMKAIFLAQGDIQTNNGGSNQNGMFRRGAYVGLQGGFGELTLGLRGNVLIAANASVVPVAGNSVTTNLSGAIGSARGGYSDFYTRNAVTYISPVLLGGLTLSGQYGMANNVNSSSDGSVTAWSAVYTTGGLRLIASSQNRMENGVASSSNTNANSTQAATSCLIVATPCPAAYQYLSPNAPTSYAKQTSLAGARYKFGKFELGGAAISNKVAKDVGGSMIEYTGTIVGGAWDLTPAIRLGLNFANSEGSYLTNAQAHYMLSKRSTVYVNAGWANNGTDGRSNFAAYASNTGNSPAVQVTGAAATADRTQSAVGVGIIHSF
jgi:predicted porin